MSSQVPGPHPDSQASRTSPTIILNHNRSNTTSSDLSGSNPTMTDSSRSSPSTLNTPSPPLRPQQTEDLLLLLIYIRRPIVPDYPHHTPPIFRHLQGIATYERHIRMLTSQMRTTYPNTPLVPVEVDLGFQYTALEHRVRSCFGDRVREMRFERFPAGRCTWNGEQAAFRQLIRGFMIFVR